jgi:two-component system cell cycle sensor histidine kinase PleC
MHALIGRPPAGRLMTFAEVNDLMHPDDVSLFRIAVDVAEGTLDIIDHEFRMRHTDGSYVWLRARAELVQAPGSPGPHLIGIAVDVTEQKELATARASADHRLRLAIESASEAIVLRDAQDRLVAWNAKFAATWRFPDGVLRPGADYRTLADHIATHTLRTETAWDGPSPAGARSYEIELVDGRWLKINERRTQEGGAVAVASDITAMKQHEAMLVDKERHLLATVADLQTSRQTLEYQAQQLADLAEKYADEKIRAEEASRAKSDFIALMSHELRTPLNAIIGFAQIMKAGTFGPLGAGKYHEYCDDIAESGETLLAIVNDILQMSSIETGRLQLDRKPIHLCTILDETVRAVAVEADRKHVSMQVQSTGHAPLIADPRAMRQILLNLMSNAVKFTPDGGPPENEHGFDPACHRRFRHRHLARIDGEDRSTVRAGRRHVHAPAWRFGPRAGDCALARRNARWHDAHPLGRGIGHHRDRRPAAQRSGRSADRRRHAALISPTTTRSARRSHARAAAVPPGRRRVPRNPVILPPAPATHATLAGSLPGQTPHRDRAAISA